MSTEIQHLAIVMDGNRRWASERGMPKIMGHTEGAKNMKPIVQAALDAGVGYLTMWALSTENLKTRSEKELKHLFSLFGKLLDYLDDFMENDVQFHTIGDLSKLPEKIQQDLAAMKEKTKENSKMVLNLAVNYGGRDEILRAINGLMSDGVGPEELTEEKFASYLDTAGMPEVDLVIRTGGHQRLSGYLPWQSTYAELYFTETKWPAFTPEELGQAMEWFGQIQRNRGK